MADTKQSRILNIFTIIVSSIAILTFAGTVLTWTYKQGTESHRIDDIEKAQKELELENIIIKTRLDEQFSAIQSANIKLTLLLDYFNITDSTRHD